MGDDKFKVNFSGNASMEEVAFKLMDRILNIPEERKEIDRKKVLDTYSECLKAVKGERKQDND